MWRRDLGYVEKRYAVPYSHALKLLLHVSTIIIPPRCTMVAWDADVSRFLLCNIAATFNITMKIPCSLWGKFWNFIWQWKPFLVLVAVFDCSLSRQKGDRAGAYRFRLLVRSNFFSKVTYAQPFISRWKRYHKILIPLTKPAYFCVLVGVAKSFAHYRQPNKWQCPPEMAGKQKQCSENNYCWFCSWPFWPRKRLLSD